MKKKTIHALYEEKPNGTPEEFPEKSLWLERYIRSLGRTLKKATHTLTSDNQVPNVP